MEDFFYGVPKWVAWLIVITVIILIVGLGANYNLNLFIRYSCFQNRN